MKGNGREKGVLCVFSKDLRFLSKTETRRVLDFSAEFHTGLVIPRRAFVERAVMESLDSIWLVPTLREVNVFCKLINLMLILLWATAYLVRNRGTDIIYTPPNLVILAGYLCSRLFRIKWTLDLYDSPIPLTVRTGIEGVIYSTGVWLYKRMINRADLVSVGIMPESTSWLKAANIIYVTNGVDNSRYRNRQDLDTGGRVPVIFLETSMVRSGIEDLMSAIAMLVAQGITNMELVLIGFVDENGRIAGLVQEYGVADYVRYLGLVGSENLPEKLLAARIGVHPFPSGPHRDEIFPLKIFEYLAAGLAIVSYDLKGVAHVIKDGHNGVLVEPDNPEALARGLRKVITEAELRETISANALASAAQYDWDIINGRIIEGMKALC